MPDRGDVLVSIRAVTKDYRSLRPLRVEQLDLWPGQTTALLGMDAAAAEVLVNLITTTTLPDAGEVCVFGRATTEVKDRDAWIDLLDHFGILSERAVLVDSLSVRQNLLMPHSLEVDEPSEEVCEKVARMVEEIGLDASVLDQPAGEVGKAVRARVRLGRALALKPRVLLVEHPSTLVDEHEAKDLATDLARVVAARKVACLVMTADRAFAYAVTDRVLELEAATGRLRPPSRWKRFFS